MEKTRKKMVLVVDDESNVRLLVHRILNNKYAVIEAGDGHEAINVACCEKPDLILMDVLMPRMDGLNACYAIKTNPITKEIPVVMLTALDFDLNKRLSEEVMGANDYLTKPFSSEALLETIGRYVGS